MSIGPACICWLICRPCHQELTDDPHLATMEVWAEMEEVAGCYAPGGLLFLHYRQQSRVLSAAATRSRSMCCHIAASCGRAERSISVAG